MRFEELSFGLEGGSVTLRLDRQLTVIAGMDATAREQWVRRMLGALHGTPPGYGTSLVLEDGSRRQVRLTRDPRGATRAIDVDSGEDVTGDLGGDGPLDWLALLGLDQAAARAVMIVEAGEDVADTADVGPMGVEEVAEAREVLARVEVDYEEARAVAQAVEGLRDRLASVEERLRRRTVEALEAARSAFGDRPRLEPSELERGLLLPAEAPAGLAEAHRSYLAAARRRAEAQARLNEATGRVAPSSVDWVPTLAATDLAELWARAERLRSAATRLAEITRSRAEAGGEDVITRIEAAHAEVEGAERRLARARLRCGTARGHLAEAQETERQVLAEAGFESWLGFRLRLADVAGADAPDSLQTAEAEVDTAAAAWAEMAGAVEVEAALAVRQEVESYAVYLAARADLEAATAACRQDLKEAEVAYVAARAALIGACGPFDVEPDNAPQQVAALVQLAIHARLQRGLEEAEAAEQAVRAMETYASVPGTDALWVERAGLLRELAATEVDVARTASLAGQVDTLRHRISVLEASSRSLSGDDPEMALLTRFAVARRAGPQGEPLPLVFDDALVRYGRADKWSLLELLARLGETAQVVYLTDDPEAAQWAAARSHRGDVAFLDVSPRPTVSCRDCGAEATTCVVQVRGDHLCTTCALARLGLRKRGVPDRAPGASYRLAAGT